MPPHQRKTLPEPNKDNPLAESSLNRRLWAAYLHRGYTRADFARMLGLHYTGLYAIDVGKSGVPKLQTLILSSQLLGFSLDDLVFGHARPVGAAEVELTRDGVKAVLVKIGADTDVIEMLGDYVHSSAGHFQTFTRSWVEAFNQDYRAAIADGLTPERAFERAKGAAAKARALAATAAAGRIVAPVTAAELATMGRAADGASAPVLHALPSGEKKPPLLPPPATKQTKRKRTESAKRKRSDKRADKRV